MLDCVESGAPAARGTVVWLHGLGADGHDFAPIVPALGLPLRFVFPHAPVRPVTLNGGLPMRAWFDLYGSIRDARIDEAGIAASRAAVVELLEREVASGVPYDRIVLGGFSQGGSLALATGLAFPHSLAGLVSLSAWLPATHADVDEAQRGTPIFIGHGTNDPVVPAALGRATHATLAGRGCRVEWHEYPIQHGVSDAVIADLRTFLAGLFA